MDELIRSNIEFAKKYGDKDAAWYKHAFCNFDDSEPIKSDSSEAPSATPEMTLTRFDPIPVLEHYEWKIEHFLRLKFSLWLDDTIIFCLNRYHTTKSPAIDFVADSLWHNEDTAENVHRWLGTEGVRYIFLPVHFTSGHFALVIAHCTEKKCYYVDSADGVMTASKRAEVQKLLDEWKIGFALEQLAVRAQKNSYDCGVHVISHVFNAIHGRDLAQVDSKIIDREHLYNTVLSSVAIPLKLQIEAVVDRFEKTDVKVLVCTTSKEELRSLCLQQVDFNQVQMANFRTLTTRHHLLVVNSLPQNYSMEFFNGIHNDVIRWKQSFNDFRGGGSAQPKLYAAFSKDIRLLPYYVPHSTKGLPLLVYEAQPFNDLPALKSLELLLANMGYSDFNFITVLMYVGANSHINAHRDREQILGFENAEDIIATFVFGSPRDLKIICSSQSRTGQLIPNASDSLYIMQGIQRFTKHEKKAGDGLSYSIIFRRLTPYIGQDIVPNHFNEDVQIDWLHGMVPRAWRNKPDTSSVTPGTTFKLRDFNKLRLHPVQMCSISTRNGFATSLVLYSDKNTVSDCGSKVWFVGYSTKDKKSMVFNNYLLATCGVSSVAIFKKLENGDRQYLGQFSVAEAVTIQQRMYFTLLKNE